MELHVHIHVYIASGSHVCSGWLQDRHVALHSEGSKMVVNSEQPHLVGMDPDILSTGLVFYYLQVE